MYTYKFRPAYGEANLLLEFIKGPEEPEFLTDLIRAFDELDFKIESATDLWMNDEILFTISSKAGPFILSKDIWGLVFIVADTNQVGIHQLNEYLLKSNKFKKLDVDFKEYLK